MTTVSEKLNYLMDTKNIIKASINSRGGNITANTPFRAYATEIDNISISSGEFDNAWNGEWSPHWRDENGKLFNISDPDENTIKLLVGTKIKNRILSFTCTTISNGNFSVDFGDGSEIASYASGEAVIYTYDLLVHRYCVVTITSNDVLDTFRMLRTNTDQTIVLWATVNAFLSSLAFGDAVTTGIRTCSSHLECAELKNIKKISDNCFFNSHALQKCNIPPTVTEIGVRAFFNCFELRNIEIPSSVTVIRDRAFLHCNSLSNDLVLSANTRLTTNIFQSIYKLNSITHYYANVEPIEETNFIAASGLTTYDAPNSRVSRIIVSGHPDFGGNLGLLGNIPGYDSPIRLDWENSSFSSGNVNAIVLDFSHQRSLTRDQLVSIFRHLPAVATPRRIQLQHVPAANLLSADDRAIATSKNFTF